MALAAVNHTVADARQPAFTGEFPYLIEDMVQATDMIRRGNAPLRSRLIESNCQLEFGVRCADAVEDS